jgi:energy-coupling factor transporter ATP-binding protein EcfA2
MLETLEFHNYRCFSSHILPLKNETIIVGRNNAGKSTIIEGLRLVGIVTERFKNLKFEYVPDWLDLPNGYRGARIDLSGLNINWENLFHRYGPPPARVVAKFANKSSIAIHFGPDRAVFIILHDSDNRLVWTKRLAASLDLPRVSVLPQVMPLNREELILVPNYVRANQSSYLSPLHFRNQLHLFHKEHFSNFKTLVEASWPGIQIRELNKIKPEEEDSFQRMALSLLVRDGDFVAEVGCMGHGLQMWLQTMWFLTRNMKTDTIVLDEPDVYMHPDLQRRLLRFIRGRYQQCIIATHSTEIIAEAETSNILIADRNRKKSSFTDSLPAVQTVLDQVGSAQNLQLTRLWGARKLLLVEGKDLKILKYFQNTLFSETELPFDILPNMSIGGWSGWPYAIGSAMLLRNQVGKEIMTYCILDSDYHTEEEKVARKADAKIKGVHLHIWSGKEIENYLVIPSVIARIINKKTGLPEQELSEKIEAMIDEISESLKDATTDAISAENYNRDRSCIQKANREARARVKEAWSSFHSRILVVSGKQLLSNLSQRTRNEFGISFSAISIARELRRNEMRQEVVDVISAIENARPMPYSKLE